MKFTQTGVIIDSEEAAYIMKEMVNSHLDEGAAMFKKMKEIALEHDLPDFEISKEKYYTLSQRLEIIIAEREESDREEEKKK